MDFKKAFISELKPAKYNPRKDLTDKDPEYQRIKRSIEEFGYVDPVIVNSDYTVIGGHQRLKVLKELGQAQIDVVVVDIPKNKERALNVALNKISGEWDTQRLTDLLGEIKADGLLELTGFDDKEFDQILRELHKDDKTSNPDPTSDPASCYTPQFSTPQVTDSDVAATDRKLEQITREPPKMIGVFCPKCGHEFEIGG